MKSGRTLTELAAELERQATARKDYIAPQGKLRADVVDGEVVLDVKDEPKAISNLAHSQLAQDLAIPQKYYDKMRTEDPDLLAHNVNAWFRKDPDAKRMVRTLDGTVRAVLSPKYRPLDNYDLATAVLPALMEKKAEIMSADLTETRFYIKAILPDLSDELPAGMAYGTGHNAIGTMDRGRLVSAIVISNSDVGLGALRVEPSVFTTWCTNLAIMKQAAMRKYHVGRAFDADASNWEVFRDATREADDVAFWMKVKDVSMAAFNPEIFHAAIAQMRAAAGKPITTDDINAVVELAVEELNIPPRFSNGILKALAAGGDFTQFGLSSAITRVANDADEYEAATQLEHAGGEVLALSNSRWDEIAKAA